MQRSLLPRSRPVIEGLEVGEVYEPSARVDVGGDVYDFLALDDGRLAVVLGDVTGHGVDATADMAMAKFVFRSLAREHPEPADFLASANDVICSEIATGKFISMSYVVVDGGSGRVAGASAGHPAPRIVLPDGSTRPLEAHGLVLGIDGGQEYAESHERATPSVPRSSSTPTASSRRGGTASCTGTTVSTRCSRSGTSCRRARSPPRWQRTRASSPAATSPTTSRSSSFARREPPDRRRYTGRKLESDGPWPSAPASSSVSSSAPSASGQAMPEPTARRLLR